MSSIRFPFNKTSNGKVKSLLRFFKTKLLTEGFWGHVTVLAGGTGFSQLILLAAMPILTRIYDPESFGLLTIFVSMAGLLSVIASLRYELAIPLPSSQSVAFNITLMAFFIICVFTLCSTIIFFVYGDALVKILNTPQMSKYIYWLPAGIMAIGSQQIITYWFVREKKFAKLSRAKIGQSCSMSFIQIILGGAKLHGLGLITGFILGRVTAIILLARDVIRAGRPLLSDITLLSLKESAIRYKKFPLISSWSALLNQGGVLIAPILFASFFGTNVAGWYGLAERIAGLPLALIGQSVSQVYMGEASKLRLAKPDEMLSLFNKTARKLFLFISIPVMFGGLMAPWIFSSTFGKQWYVSGKYIAVLLPMFAAQTVVFPLSQTLNILERQDLQLIWDFLRLLIVICVILISNFFLKLDSLATIIFYGLAMSFMYIILFLIMRNQLIKLSGRDLQI